MTINPNNPPLPKHDTDEQAICHGLMSRIDAIKADIGRADIDRTIKTDLECFANYLDDAVHDYLAPAVKAADERARYLHGDDREHMTVAQERALMPRR